MTTDPVVEERLDKAAQALAEATVLYVGAGAGMGVDSGLPDFRGNAGFWNAYPPYRELGLDFARLANPTWFRRDPALAWGFYGHRLELYRATEPHTGFTRILEWSKRTRHGAFVFTSNVDGHFQRAGFPEERVYECHGAIERLQCLDGCGAEVFPAAGIRVEVDRSTFRAVGALPSCPSCGGPARPNILMFGDGGYDDEPARRRAEEFGSVLREIDLSSERMVVIECGAGTSIPTVRNHCEALMRMGATLIRINLREPETPSRGIGVRLGALAALEALDARLRTLTNDRFRNQSDRAESVIVATS